MDKYEQRQREFFSRLTLPPGFQVVWGRPVDVWDLRDEFLELDEGKSDSAVDAVLALDSPGGTPWLVYVTQDVRFEHPYRICPTVLITPPNEENFETEEDFEAEWTSLILWAILKTLAHETLETLKLDDQTLMDPHHGGSHLWDGGLLVSRETMLEKVKVWRTNDDLTTAAN